jgi:hypothetical protein
VGIERRHLPRLQASAAGDSADLGVGFARELGNVGQRLLAKRAQIDRPRGDDREQFAVLLDRRGHLGGVGGAEVLAARFGRRRGGGEGRDAVRRSPSRVTVPVDGDRRDESADQWRHSLGELTDCPSG